MADTQFDDVVAKELVGDSWPVNHPGADPVLYGHVSLEPKGAFEARSLQTFKLVYTVGRYGIDDTGSCLLYTSPSPRDYAASRMPSSA